MVFQPWQMLDHFGHDEVVETIRLHLETNKMDLFAICHLVMDPETKEQFKTISLFSRVDTPFAQTFHPLVKAMK